MNVDRHRGDAAKETPVPCVSWREILTHEISLSRYRLQVFASSDQDTRMDVFMAGYICNACPCFCLVLLDEQNSCGLMSRCLR